MNFARVVKYLDIWSGRKSTEAETKYPKSFHILKSRPIKKIPYVITLPAYSEAAPTIARNTILFQYNVTAPKGFLIANLAEIQQGGAEYPLRKVGQGYLTVKWRSGETATRLFITGRTYHLIPEPHVIVVAPDENYLAQTIPVNCCFEYWWVGADYQDVHAGILSDIVIRTNFLVNPDYPEELSRSFATPVFRYKDAMSNLLWPENIPSPYTEQAFLDNP